MSTGFLYLAVVLHAWSRRSVGWAFSADLYTCHEAMAFEEMRREGMPLPEVRPGVRDDVLARHGSELIQFRAGLTRDQAPQARMA